MMMECISVTSTFINCLSYLTFNQFVPFCNFILNIVIHKYIGKNFNPIPLHYTDIKKDYGRNSKFTSSRTPSTFSSRLLHWSLASPNSLSKRWIYDISY